MTSPAPVLPPMSHDLLAVMDRALGLNAPIEGEVIGNVQVNYRCEYDHSCRTIHTNTFYILRNGNRIGWTSHNSSRRRYQIGERISWL